MKSISTRLDFFPREFRFLQENSLLKNNLFVNEKSVPGHSCAMEKLVPPSYKLW